MPNQRQRQHSPAPRKPTKMPKASLKRPQNCALQCLVVVLCFAGATFADYPSMSMSTLMSSQQTAQSSPFKTSFISAGDFDMRPTRPELSLFNALPLANLYGERSEPNDAQFDTNSNEVLQFEAAKVATAAAAATTTAGQGAVGQSEQSTLLESQPASVVYLDVNSSPEAPASSNGGGGGSNKQQAVEGSQTAAADDLFASQTAEQSSKQLAGRSAVDAAETTTASATTTTEAPQTSTASTTTTTAPTTTTSVPTTTPQPSVAQQNSTAAQPQETSTSLPETTPTAAVASTTAAASSTTSASLTTTEVASTEQPKSTATEAQPKVASSTTEAAQTTTTATTTTTTTASASTTTDVPPQATSTQAALQPQQSNESNARDARTNSDDGVKQAQETTTTPTTVTTITTTTTAAAATTTTTTTQATPTNSTRQQLDAVPQITVCSAADNCSKLSFAKVPVVVGPSSAATSGNNGSQAPVVNEFVFVPADAPLEFEAVLGGESHVPDTELKAEHRTVDDIDLAGGGNAGGDLELDYSVGASDGVSSVNVEQVRQQAAQATTGRQPNFGGQAAAASTVPSIARLAPATSVSFKVSHLPRDSPTSTSTTTTTTTKPTTTTTTTKPTTTTTTTAASLLQTRQRDASRANQKIMRINGDYERQRQFAVRQAAHVPSPKATTTRPQQAADGSRLLRRRPSAPPIAPANTNTASRTKQAAADAAEETELLSRLPAIPQLKRLSKQRPADNSAGQQPSRRFVEPVTAANAVASVASSGERLIARIKRPADNPPPPSLSASPTVKNAAQSFKQPLAPTTAQPLPDRRNSTSASFSAAHSIIHSSNKHTQQAPLITIDADRQQPQPPTVAAVNNSNTTASDKVATAGVDATSGFSVSKLSSQAAALEAQDMEIRANLRSELMSLIASSLKPTAGAVDDNQTLVGASASGERLAKPPIVSVVELEPATQTLGESARKARQSPDNGNYTAQAATTTMTASTATITTTTSPTTVVKLTSTVSGNNDSNLTSAAPQLSPSTFKMPNITTTMATTIPKEFTPAPAVIVDHRRQTQPQKLVVAQRQQTAQQTIVALQAASQLAAKLNEFEASVERQLAEDAMHNTTPPPAIFANKPNTAPTALKASDFATKHQAFVSAPKQTTTRQKQSGKQPQAVVGGKQFTTIPVANRGHWEPSSTSSGGESDGSYDPSRDESPLGSLSSLPFSTSDSNSLPGRPGVDYPIHSFIPKTSFDCGNYQQGGFYADVETDCQVYHSCHKGRGGWHSFLCSNGTVFSQELLTCDWWFNVECATSKLFVGPQSFVDEAIGHGFRFKL